MNQTRPIVRQVGGMALALARRGLPINLLVSIAAPAATYQILTGRGVSAVDALIVAAMFPLVGTSVGAIRARKLEPLGALSLLAIALGVAAALLFANPRFLLVKDSAVTGLIGLAFLGSLLAPRPLPFVIGRQFFTGGDPEEARRYDASWELASVRSRARRATVVWGAALLAEASLRIGLSFVLPPATLLAISPLLALGTFGPLGLWTLRLRGQASSRIRPGHAS